MENGNEAGSLNVNLGSRSKELNTDGLWSGCSIVYAFYPECNCELKPIATEHRLILELAIEFEAFNEDGKLVLESLSAVFQQSIEIRPDALLIPLDHQYNQQNLFLKGMRGRDVVVAKIFQSIGDFHVHLALFTDDPDQSTARLGEAFSSPSNSKRRNFKILSVSKDVKHLTYWISFDSSPINFEILCSAESESNVIVTQGITLQRTESAKEPQENENALFTSALVIWPVGNTKKIEDKLKTNCSALSIGPYCVTELDCLFLPSLGSVVRCHTSPTTSGTTWSALRKTRFCWRSRRFAYNLISRHQFGCSSGSGRVHEVAKSIRSLRLNR
jgi:hypothetical protein